jgi:hypothetical protein
MNSADCEGMPTCRACFMKVLHSHEAGEAHDGDCAAVAPKTDDPQPLPPFDAEPIELSPIDVEYLRRLADWHQRRNQAPEPPKDYSVSARFIPTPEQCRSSSLLRGAHVMGMTERETIDWLYEALESQRRAHIKYVEETMHPTRIIWVRETP